jgi:hypothetical protein
MSGSPFSSPQSVSCRCSRNVYSRTKITEWRREDQVGYITKIDRGSCVVGFSRREERIKENDKLG